MNKANFSPGFVISVADIVVLIVGIIGTIFFWYQAWWAGFVIGFVIIHFFLFCNVFRIPRSLELIWAFVFFVFASSTILKGIPSWSQTFIASVALSAFLIWKATGKDAYHGICWRTWNPNLKDWWESQNNTIESKDNETDQSAEMGGANKNIRSRGFYED